MSERTALTRNQSLRLLLSPICTDSLADLTWRQIAEGIADADLGRGPFREWPLDQREHLRAVLRLCALYFPVGPRNSERTASVGDIAARFLARVQDYKERTIWLVCVAPDGRVEEEVLVALGGHPTRPPALRTLLRHLVIRSPARAYIVDFRPFTTPLVEHATRLLFTRLRELGDVAGVRCADWVLVGYDGVSSVVEAVRCRSGEDESDAQAA